MTSLIREERRRWCTGIAERGASVKEQAMELEARFQELLLDQEKEFEEWRTDLLHSERENERRAREKAEEAERDKSPRKSGRGGQVGARKRDGGRSMARGKRASTRRGVEVFARAQE